jgi:hypothetical protein
MAIALILGPSGQPVAAASGLDNIAFKSGAFTLSLQAGGLNGNKVLSLGSLATQTEIDKVAMIGIPYHNKSQSNSPATITIQAPGAGFAIQLNHVIFSYDSIPENGLLTISDGQSQIYQEIAITSGGAGPVVSGIRLPGGSGLSIVLSAGGVGIIGRVSASVLTVVI